MTAISCFNCEKTVDTKKEKLIMTISWLYKDLLKQNSLNSDKNPPRVLGICSNCWKNVFKKKLDLKDWYWEYNQSI